VLEGVEGVIEGASGVAFTQGDADDAALLLHHYSPALLCHS
jgi:hypothetical protein